jgi:aspartate aminotransferase
VYREFVYDGQRHTSLFHLDGLEDRGILIDSVSKRFSACGARIGCTISRNPELNDILLRFGQARLCPPTVDQIAARAALSTPQSYLDDVRTEYERRRNVLVGALQELPGVGCTTPAGAFYLMAQLPVDDADTFCQWILREFELDGKSVMMAPGDGFYVSPRGGKREVRIAYVLRSEDLVDAVRVLGAALDAYPNATRA